MTDDARDRPFDVKRVIPKDAIPSIDDPSFGTGFRGSAGDRVVVPDLPGTPWRAYPLRILDFHEVVNDRIGDVPVAVTWCPLCGTVVVYDRRVDGRTLTFGVSGKLAADNLVMYDRETDSEWKQSTGTCIEGPLSGKSLDVRPAALTTCERYLDVVDTPRVLEETDQESEAASESNTPARIDYDREPYQAYFESSGFGLAAHRNESNPRTWNRTDLDPKTRVLGVGTGSEAVGIPRPWIDERGGVVDVTVGEVNVLVFGAQSGMYVYESPGVEFSLIGDDRYRGDGAVWDALTAESDDGRTLERVPARREFAFTWQDDHGPDSFGPAPS